MARQYKLTIDRDAVTAKLFVHDDDKIEVIDADDMVDSTYLLQKLNLLKDLVALMRKYGVSSWKCTWEP